MVSEFDVQLLGRGFESRLSTIQKDKSEMKKKDNRV